MRVVRCALCGARCAVRVVRCALCVVRFALCVVRRALYGACVSVRVVRCVLCVARCVLLQHCAMGVAVDVEIVQSPLKLQLGCVSFCVARHVMRGV